MMLATDDGNEASDSTRSRIASLLDTPRSAARWEFAKAMHYSHWMLLTLCAVMFAVSIDGLLRQGDPFLAGIVLFGFFLWIFAWRCWHEGNGYSHHWGPHKEWQRSEIRRRVRRESSTGDTAKAPRVIETHLSGDEMEQLLTTIRAGALAKTLEAKLDENYVPYVRRGNDFIVTIDSEARSIWRTLSPQPFDDDLLVSSRAEGRDDKRRT